MKVDANLRVAAKLAPRGVSEGTDLRNCFKVAVAAPDRRICREFHGSARSSGAFRNVHAQRAIQASIRAISGLSLRSDLESLEYGRYLLAAWQFEGANARLPACGGRHLTGQSVILVNVPEGAVVGRVDRDVGIIAPPRVGRRLHPGAIDDRAFAESHLA